MEPNLYRSMYRGTIQGVILDWAGTMVDFGCLAPTAVFTDVFEKFGVAVTVEEVRRFMGLMKKDHIRSLCRLPTVSKRWHETYQQQPGETDIDTLYAETETMMIQAITRHADLIPGSLETIKAFRANGLKIGSCTGYTRPMMEVLLPVAKAQGYQLDVMVCSSDVTAGRPYPWMCYRNALELEVFPFAALVKIGDTISDIEEGLNADMWTIGLTQSGNELGLSQADVAALPQEELESRLHGIEQRFKAAGAHYVTEGIWNCAPILESINRRLAQGDHPLFERHSP